MQFSVGRVLKDIIKNGIKPAYFLLGDDYFMQNIFIKKLLSNFSDSIKTEYFYLNEDIDLSLLLDNITLISLFNNNNVYVIKNFNKISKDYQQILINYLNKSDNKNILIFVLNDFSIKNKIAKKISENTIIVDTRTPFNKLKIKEWVQYYFKNDNIFIEDNVLDYFVDNYSDDISTIINEVEKHYLYSNKKNINFNLINDTYSSRHIKIWNLLDALGEKKIEEALNVYNNLYINGTSLVPILIQLSNFYSEILIDLNLKSKNTYSSLNKILQSKLRTYKSYYNRTEIMNIILNLRNIDIQIRTETINDQILFSTIILKICNGYYANK